MVLRFWNHQLRGELEAIRFEIWHALMKRTGRVGEIASYLPKVAPSPPMGERESEGREREHNDNARRPHIGFPRPLGRGLR
jgi:hypothetical protein